MTETNDIYGDIKIKKGTTDIHIHDDGTNSRLTPTNPFIAENVASLNWQYGADQDVASGYYRITQALHGFVVGDVLRGNPVTPGTFAKACADTDDNAEVVGIVAYVIGVNDFIMATGSGTYVTGLVGLTPGEVLWLSDVTPGLMVNTPPTVLTSIDKPIFQVESATTGFFQNFRGIEVGSPIYSDERVKINIGDSTTSYLSNKLTFSGGCSVTDADIGGGNLQKQVTVHTRLHEVTDALDHVSNDAANKVMHGGAGGNPTFSQVVEADMLLANNTTNNATAARHGFLPLLSNVATQFLDGQGNWSVPAGVVSSYTEQAFNATTSVNVVHNFGVIPIVQVTDSNGDVLIAYRIRHNTLNDFTVTFDANHTGNVQASVGSPQPQAVKIVNNDYTVLTTDRIIQCTASGKTISLPTAVTTGREFKIDNNSGGNITIDCVVGGQLIQGHASQTLPTDDCMSVYSDGTNWRFC